MRADKTIAVFGAACVSLAVATGVAAENESTEKSAQPAAEVKADEAKTEAAADDSAAAFVSELMTTEKLRREALDLQAGQELAQARAAMANREWDEAFKQYQFASTHLTDRPDSAKLRKECSQGMAEAKFQAAKQAAKEGYREGAIELAKEAVKYRHPHAGALVASLESDNATETATDVSEIKHARNDEKYKAERETIRQRLRLSAQYLAVADLESALEQCDLVLRNDPYNQEAISIRDRIQAKRQIIIEKEREATRRGMIADVGAAWRPVYAVNSVELKDVSGATAKTPIGGDPMRSIEQSIEKRMREMMLPQISFRPPATIIDAVDYFRQASKDYDKPEIPVDQRGFNFVLQLGKTLTGSESAPVAAKDDNAFGAAAEEESGAAGDVPQVPNISASNVSLAEALKLVCKVTGFKYKVQGSVVMVMPKDMTTDELVTRSYSVVDSFVDRMNEASSSLKNEKAGAFGGEDDAKASSDGDEAQWKAYFEAMGVSWPQNSHITYIKAIGKLRVTNTEDQLAKLEEALTELNVTPYNVEIETRFVEVSQEDLNSLGFEWLLNSDYSFNVGGKLAKALNLKDGNWNGKKGDTILTGWTQTGERPGSNELVDLGTGAISPITTSGTGSSVGSTSGTSQPAASPDGTGGNPAAGWTTTQRAEWSRIMSNSGREWVTSPGSGRNVGINGINGTDYATGLRYLSTEGNHISGEGASNNDKFMKMNAFLGNADLSMILHMLSQRSDTDLLSAPKVVTKSNQEATIKVVTIYRFPQDYDVTIQSTSSSSTSSITGGTGSGGDGKILPMVEPQNFETQEVGVILTVTPDVTPEGLINLALNPKVISEPTWKDYGMKVPMASVMSSAAQELAMKATGGGQDMNWFTVPMEQPFFKERSIDTHVTLYDGSTIVMGGLITEERKSMEDKIPYLGDLPFIGRIFRSRSEWSNKRNLLLFVTARRVDPNGRQVVQVSSADVPATEAKATPAPEAQ